MLVLSRKPGEEIVIGEKIRLTVLGIRGQHIRLGLTAPDDTHIRRGELARINDQERLADNPPSSAESSDSTARPAV